MSEIFVEEENTVYELDEECMKRKEKMKQGESTSMQYRAQGSQRKLYRDISYIIMLLHEIKSGRNS